MDSKKKIVIFISILVFIILIILVILLEKSKKAEKIKEIEAQNPELTVDLNVKKLDDEKEFFNIQNCINEFFIAINNEENDKIMNILSKEYINKNTINSVNDITDIYKLEGNFEKFLAEKIYYRQLDAGNIYQYFVFGKLIKNNNINRIYLIANLDYENNTFNISLPENTNISEQEYIKIIDDLVKDNTSEFVSVDNLDNTSSININNNNTFSISNIQSKDVLRYYLENYAFNAVYDTEKSYELLDEEYRSKRFENYDEYKTYIDRISWRLLNSTVEQYNIIEKEDYKEYIIIDVNNFYYNFRVKEVADYNVLLDFYTIDLEQITSQYDDANTQQKVAINIQKIVSAIMSYDYRYVYNKLNDTYKSNNYKTFEEFERYMSSNFTGNYNIQFDDFYNEGETYIYNIKFIGSTVSNMGTINMQIIMQLKDDRDFVMSFNIGED